MSVELQEQYDRVYQYCYYRLGDAYLAEDITQETFLRFLESDSYQDTGRPLAYLYTVAKHLCIDESRKKKTEPLPEDLPERDKEEEQIDSIMLREALKDLEEREREMIFLRYVNEVPVADLAAFYGKSRYALYREIKKILKKLERRMLGEQ